MRKDIKVILTVCYLLLLIAVPSFTIYKNNQVLTEGEVFRFKVMPIDPYDPFRGAYVTLRYEQRRVSVFNRKEMKDEQEVFLVLGKNEEGFVVIKDAVIDEPKSGAYLKTDLRYRYPKSEQDSVTLNIQFPFDRYYLGEEDAKLAEMNVRGLSREGLVYVDVSISNGVGGIQELYFDGIPVKQYLKDIKDLEQMD